MDNAAHSKGLCINMALFVISKIITAFEIWKSWALIQSILLNWCQPPPWIWLACSSPGIWWRPDLRAQPCRVAMKWHKVCKDSKGWGFLPPFLYSFSASAQSSNLWRIGPFKTKERIPGSRWGWEAQGFQSKTFILQDLARQCPGDRRSELSCPPAFFFF